MGARQFWQEIQMLSASAEGRYRYIYTARRFQV